MEKDKDKEVEKIFEAHVLKVVEYVPISISAISKENAMVKGLKLAQEGKLKFKPTPQTGYIVAFPNKM